MFIRSTTMDTVSPLHRHGGLKITSRTTLEMGLTEDDWASNQTHNIIFTTDRLAGIGSLFVTSCRKLTSDARDDNSRSWTNAAGEPQTCDIPAFGVSDIPALQDHFLQYTIPYARSWASEESIYHREAMRVYEVHKHDNICQLISSCIEYDFARGSLDPTSKQLD
jgi:hypothetical protein